MKSRTHLLLVFFGFSLPGSCLHAAPSGAVVPRLVSFSGKAVDVQAKVISGIVGTTFAIYKDKYEGVPLWLETQNVQADAKGNNTVQLGAAKPDGLPLDRFSSGEVRWPGVSPVGEAQMKRCRFSKTRPGGSV